MFTFWSYTFWSPWQGEWNCSQKSQKWRLKNNFIPLAMKTYGCLHSCFDFFKLVFMSSWHIIKGPFFFSHNAYFLLLTMCFHRFFSILLCLGGNLHLFHTFQPMHLRHWPIHGKICLFNWWSFTLLMYWWCLNCFLSWLVFSSFYFPCTSCWWVPISAFFLYKAFLLFLF